MSFSSLVIDGVVEDFIKNGFIVIKIPDLARCKLEEAFLAGATFFNSTLEEKMRNRAPDDAGYRPYGIEYSASAFRPDEVESFTISHRGQPKRKLYSNVAEKLYQRLFDLFELFEPVAEELTGRLASTITTKIGSSKFAGSFRFTSLLQLNHSFPSKTRVDYINEVHEDGCLVTITSVTGPGLEIQAPDGSFLPMLPSEDELLIMAGQILSLLSGGVVRPIYHRVRPDPSCHERMSLVFFADPHPAACEPWIVNTTNSNVNIGDLILKNPTRYGLSEWTLESLQPRPLSK